MPDAAKVAGGKCEYSDRQGIGETQNYTLKERKMRRKIGVRPMGMGETSSLPSKKDNGA